MKAAYHRLITTTALESLVSPRALEAILLANLGQDRWVGLLFHPEFHFDDSRFQAGTNYLAEQRSQAHSSLGAGNPLLAWRAFGRLAHAVQDFYAHSNYVQLFLESYPQSPPSEIDPLVPEILNDQRLHSGAVHWGWELILHFLPGLASLLQDYIPADTHAAMNLDHPNRSPLFDFALIAAVKRTAYEFDELLRPLDAPARSLMCDRPQ